MESSSYSLQLSRTVDRHVCFYGWVNQNVHKRTTFILCIVSFVWIPLSFLFDFSVCQLVRIIFLFFCKYFFLSKKKRKIFLMESSLYSLQLNHTVDKLVGFYGYVNENVHERTTLFISVVSFVWIPLSFLLVFFVCHLVRIVFLFFCKYFFLSKKKRKNISNGIVFVFLVVESYY